uniref:Uncharacterized protein n=2 Tax=Cacopsylla melanoneura TaxID=428564 RepID=A0A8D8TGL3_9HEMI
MLSFCEWETNALIFTFYFPVKMAKKRKTTRDIEKIREQKKLSMRKLRERRRANPKLHEEVKARVREYRRKKKAEGRIKGIAELSPREQEAQREDWRLCSARWRARNKKSAQFDEFGESNNICDQQQ